MTLEERKLACWRMATVLSRKTLVADPLEDASKLFRWCEGTDNPKLATVALESAMEVRTGGASVDSLLRAAQEAYTFARTSVGVAPSVSRAVGSRRKKSVRKKAD